MPTKNIPIKPGGQYSDVVETALASNQHQEIINLRQNKIGEWECVEGYKEVITGFTLIKTAVEITDDRSGDRFLLIQDDATLYRVDYDIGNSPVFGYENETEFSITLPSGVTIPNTLRFFYFRGVVRITGGTEPMWYGYIDRTLFPNSWSVLDLDDFNSGVDGWAGSNATVVQETTSPLLEGAGTLSVTLTDPSGYAWKAFTVVSGTKYKFFIKGLKESGQGSANYQIMIGTTQGGTEIATVTHDTYDEWHVFEYEFTASTTTVYVALKPNATDYAHWDYSWMRQNHQIVLADWYIYKAQLPKPTDTQIVSIDVRAQGAAISPGSNQCLGAIGFGYDESQFGMLREDQVFTNNAGGFNRFIDNVNVISSGGYGVVEFDPEIDGAMTDYRITSILIAMYFQLGQAGILNPEWGDYNVYEDIDFTDEYEKGWIFVKANMASLAADHYRLNLWQTGDIDQRWWDGLFQVGRRIKLNNSVGSIDTVIIGYNEATSNDQNHYITILDDTIDLGAYDTDFSTMGIWIEKIWDYSGGDYKMRVAAEIGGTHQGGYAVASEIPSGTKNNTPDYSHHVIIEERAYVASKEDEEEDAVRYSPLLQFDNLPIGNLIQTQVGDIDATRAIVGRAGRLVMLKRHSISQGNFIGGQYYEDIGLHDSGLYADFGYLVIDDILYYMDREECFAFYGQRPVPLLVNALQRKIYRENVSEDSLIFHDKINNEIWFVLKGVSPALILVFHPERKEWYTRETDIASKASFLDYEKKMLVVDTDKIVTFNHDATTFDETILWSILTKIWLKDTAEYHIKCNKLYALMKGSSLVTVKTRDPEDTSSLRTQTFTPDTDDIRTRRVKPLLLGRMLEFLIYTAETSTQQATIRSIDAEIEIWK